jgi:hypothetical protein
MIMLSWIPKIKLELMAYEAMFATNLENAAKVPGDIGGSRGVQGVLSRVLTKGWPRVSLGFVGDVFEVMA